MPPNRPFACKNFQGFSLPSFLFFATTVYSTTYKNSLSILLQTFYWNLCSVLYVSPMRNWGGEIAVFGPGVQSPGVNWREKKIWFTFFLFFFNLLHNVISLSW